MNVIEIESKLSFILFGLTVHIIGIENWNYCLLKFNLKFYEFWVVL